MLEVYSGLSGIDQGFGSPLRFVCSEISSSGIKFTLPDSSAVDYVLVDEENIGLLEKKNIKIEGAYGKGNIIVLERGNPPVSVRIRFNKGSGNVVLIGASSALSAVLIFEGGPHLVCVGGSAANGRTLGQVVFRGRYNCFLLGSGGSVANASLWIEGDEKFILIGDDPLFSWDIYLRTADGHALIDLERASVINEPQSIVVGSHVWVGQSALLLKGAKVGCGSIIGARSVVSKTIPSCSAAAGSPAKVVRSKVSWTRQANPDASIIQELVHSSASW